MTEFCEEKEITYEFDKKIRHRLIFLRETFADGTPLPLPCGERVFVCCKSAAEMFIEYHMPKLLTINDMHEKGILPPSITFKGASECPFKGKPNCDKVLHSIYFEEFRPANQAKGTPLRENCNTCCFEWAKDYCALLERHHYAHPNPIGEQVKEEFEAEINSQH